MYNLIFSPAFFFGQPLFYDIPEYLNIVLYNPFWQAISLGHFPIHPVFLGILWIMIKFFPVNLIAILFGAYSVFLVYKISKIVFGKGILPSIIFALFPGVWLINTNLMVESITLTFFLLSVYFFLSKKSFGFFISLFLMVGTHLESIFWIPAIFLLPFIFEEESRFTITETLHFFKYAAVSTVISLAGYLSIYIFSGRNFSGSTEQLSTYLSSGILRMIRNSWLSFEAAFGSLSLFLIIFLIIKNAKSKVERISWAIFFGLVFLIGANWQGDFMPRRIIFAGLILSLGVYKYLRRKSFLYVLYLVPLVAANVLLYSQGSPFTPGQLPKNQILLETHYLKPFTKYDGTILWIGENDLGRINDYLKSGKRVFLSKNAVTAPYLLLVGNNYHITSLGRAGDSESRFLFKKYKVESYKDYFELKLMAGPVSKNAGEPLIFYSNGLARRRIDYGDIGIWIWAILTKHRDASFWIYKDATGQFPISL